MVLNMSGDSWSAVQCFRVDGETKYHPVSLRGFSLLENLLINPSGMETSRWEWGWIKPLSCAKAPAKAPAAVGGGGEAGELEPLDGVTGDGVGSVPLSFKAIGKLWDSGLWGLLCMSCWSHLHTDAEWLDTLNPTQSSLVNTFCFSRFSFAVWQWARALPAL